MFEDLDRMQCYYHQLLQTADEMEATAYRLRSQAEEALVPIHPDDFSGRMLDYADASFQLQHKHCQHLRQQAEEVRKWIDHVSALIPPAPPVP